MAEEKNSFRSVKIFFWGYFMVLILLLTFVGIMDWLGFEAVDTSIVYVLFGLLVCSALIAGTVFVLNRIMRKWLKIMVGSACALMVLAASIGMLVFFSAMMYSVPAHYTTLTSPAGADAVVLRRIYWDMENMMSRLDTLGEEAIEMDGFDLGYEYLAYPEKLGFFYNKKIASEGRLEIGFESEASLMYEWLDDNTLHMYIEKPETGDSGELKLVLP